MVWILTNALIRRLEAFQAKLVKRVLKWPKYHSNIAAAAALDMPTMKCRVLERKLGLLMRVMAGDTDSLSGSILLAMCDDVESICLVRECREMEEHFGTHFTSDIKKEPTCNLKEIKIIIEADKKMTMKCEKIL